EIAELVAFERRLGELRGTPLERLGEVLREAKRLGYSDAQIARALAVGEDAVRARRKAEGLRPAYRTVDTCAAEFAAFTPYFYSTHGEAADVLPSSGKPKVVI